MGAALTSVTIPGTILVSRALTGSPPAADGEAYWLVVVVANLFGAAAITHLGVRSFQRVLRAAQANEQRLADLVSHAPDGIIAADGEGLVITANPAAERILGVEAPALRGRSLSRVLGGAADGAEERSRVDALLRSRGGQPVSTRLRSRRGRVAWVDATVTGMPWADGTSGMQVTLRDMTEKRQSEEAQRMLQAQLEHALRLEAVGRLAGGVAHDFNNLLTVIGGAAELLLVESEEGENELAREILEAKIRGAALTKQLLSFARKDMVQPTRLSLNHVVRDMESLLSRFLTEGIQLTLDLDAPTPPVMADRPQLEQIVVNLVINAKDAIDGQGNVRITVSPPEATRGWETTRWTVPPGTVEVTVEDDGAGMDEDTAGRVFEPFFTTKPRGRGTGLGLATVHGVVGHNGGRVRLLSEAGVGTAVVVEWPVAPSP
jgi:PAS domain S-box-containing protein